MNTSEPEFPDPISEAQAASRICEIGDFTFIKLDPGPVETAGRITSNTIDVNLGFSKAHFSSNSDKMEDIYFPPDALAMYMAGTDMALKANNPFPGCLLEINQRTIDEWFGEADIAASNGPGFSGYRRDEQGAALGRSLIQHMAVNTLIGDDNDRMTSEALAIGIGSRMMAALCAFDGDIEAEISTWSRRGSRERMARGLDYAHSYLTKASLSATDIAAAVGLTSFHFSSIFESEMGETVNAYIERLRAEKALDMLKRSKDGLEFIAISCGFTSTVHMRKTIEERLNVSLDDLN